jgi:hypothetical protein
MIFSLPPPPPFWWTSPPRSEERNMFFPFVFGYFVPSLSDLSLPFFPRPLYMWIQKYTFLSLVHLELDDEMHTLVMNDVMVLFFGFSVVGVRTFIKTIVYTTLMHSVSFLYA